MASRKKDWEYWSDVITLGWLDRLRVKHPNLAGAIQGSIVSVLLALGAWYFLDPHFVIYGRDSSNPDYGVGRIVYGILFGIGSCVAMCCAGVCVKEGLLRQKKISVAPSPVHRKKKR